MPTCPPEFLSTALAAADAARAVTLKWFRNRLEVESKQDQSPVTVADRLAEETIRQIILEAHPGHGFLGEESGDQSAGYELRWVIDPIDGTKSFATGKPTFGTLISLLRNDTAMLGIIDHPALGERWIGQKNCETRYNDQLCHTSSVDQLADATVYTTTPDMFDDDSFSAFDGLTRNCKFRAFGGDCYSYGLLAAGYTDMVCEADLKPYDYMALVTVVEGAGGIITDWNGRALTLASGDKVIACANSELHKQAIACLNWPENPLFLS